MLTTQHSRSRQQRLLPILAQLRLDAAVIGAPHHVYYLSSHRPSWLHHGGFILFADGRTWLTAANRPPKTAAADQVDAYEAQWTSTLRSEQPALVAQQIAEQLRARGARRIGLDASPVTSHVAMDFAGERLSLEPDLCQLRRRKDPDELELMTTAIHCSEAMYRRAREIIAPGISELQVFNQVHAAAVQTAGEPLSAILGNDFTSGGGGGPPRKDHPARAGDIYILDLGPAYRGYFADNCRSFAVDRKPTDPQLHAWQAITQALTIVQRLAEPGARCRDIVAAVDEHFKAALGKPLPHHLGHGVGLQPHEFPHLNPRWDDTLLEGEVFTAEPGFYGQDLGGGMRIENQYLVTPAGVQNLLNSSMELA